MSRARRLAGRTFRSLTVRNYRLYFAGQVVSLTGTWMQSIGQMWLVLELTGSGVALGLTSALQFTPMLLFGVWGGVVADRFDKRRLLIASQALQSLPALVLGVLTATGSVRLWMVYALALVLGCFRVIDNPARQSFVSEMVGPEHVSNAVSLNSTVMTSARVVGPAIAGVVIATAGISPTFFVNAASYYATIAALAAMDPSQLLRTAPVARARGQLRAGLRYVRATPDLFWPLVMLAFVGTLSYNFGVILPLFASFDFASGARGYGLLQSAIGAGAAAGALAIAARAAPTRRMLLASTGAFGVCFLLAASAPTLAWALAAALPLGAASISYMSTTNSMLQLTSSAEMRGRVMALYSVLFLGSTPVGGPLIGWIAETLGARTALAVAGAAALAATGVGYLGLRRAALAARAAAAQARPPSDGRLPGSRPAGSSETSRPADGSVPVVNPPVPRLHE